MCLVRIHNIWSLQNTWVIRDTVKYCYTFLYVIRILYYLANNEAPPSEEALRDQEVKIMELGEQFKGEGKTQEMTDLIQKVRTILKFMSKAKAAKLVHTTW